MAVKHWTAEEREDFRTWHEKRLKELNYPEEMTAKLRRNRENWLPREKKDESST